MPGQPQPLSNPFITFDVTGATVHEIGLPPNLIISAGTPFHVDVTFEFYEMLADWLVTLGVTCQVSVKAESLGPGPEVNFGPVPVTTATGSTSYTGSVPALLPTAGAYKLACTVTVPGSPIAGYMEGPILQII